MSDNHALLRAVVGLAPSDDLIALALRRAGGDLAAAVNIVLDSPKPSQPPPPPRPLPRTIAEQVPPLVVSPRQTAVSGSSEPDKGRTLSDTSKATPALGCPSASQSSSAACIPKKPSSSVKQPAEPCPDPARPLKRLRLNESLQKMLPELRAIVGGHRGDDILALALRRSGGDLANAVNLVFDGSLTASPPSPAAVVKKEFPSVPEHPLLKVKKELPEPIARGPNMSQCDIIDIDLDEVGPPEADSSMQVCHETVKAPATSTMRMSPEAAGKAAKGDSRVDRSPQAKQPSPVKQLASVKLTWVPPSPNWSFVLGTIEVNAYSTRKVSADECFYATLAEVEEGPGVVRPLLRPGATMELRLAASGKRKARPGFGRPTETSSRVGGSINIYAVGVDKVEVGRLPAEIARALYPLMTSKVIEVEVRVGARAPRSFILGQTLPVIVQISIRGAALCSPDQVAGAARQKLAGGSERKLQEHQAPAPKKGKKARPGEEDTQVQAKTKISKAEGFEDEEADKDAQCNAVALLLRHLRLPHRGFIAPSEVAAPEDSSSSNGMNVHGGTVIEDGTLSVVGQPDEAADQDAEEKEARDDMTTEAGAQLGNRHALEHADSPAVALPETLFLSRLRHYQAQAVFWMWQRENPTSKLPPKWLEGEEGAEASPLSEKDGADTGKKKLHPMWDEYELNTSIGRLDCIDGEVQYLYHHRTSGALSLMFPDASLAFCRGGILADDMGLGKTVMCLALLAMDLAPDVPSAREEAPMLRGLEASGPAGPTTETALSFFRSNKKSSEGDRVGGTLVVMPVSLVTQWSQEALKHFPAGRPLRVHEYHGSGRHCSAQQLRACDIVLTTYGTLAAEADDGPLYQVHWRRTILDEAHCIKNRSSRMAQAAFRLRSFTRWCVTGTPLQNSIDELYALVRFLRVDPWSSWTAWKKSVTLPMERGRSGDPSAMTEALDAARRIVQPMLIRRTKMTKDRSGELLLQLPTKHVHVLELELSEPEREFYDAVYTKAKTQFDNMVSSGSALSKYTHILQLILQLRQALCHPFLVFTRDGASDADFAALEKRCLRDMAGGDSGASKAFVENLLNEVKSGSLPDCPICVERPTDPAMTPCGHIFCRDCAINASKAWSGECPICRKPGALARGALKILPGASRFPSHLVAGGADAKAEGEGAVQAHSTKMKMLIDLLQEDIKAGRRAVVFSQWTSFLDLIGAALDSVAIPNQRFDGSLSREQRGQRVAWLSEEDDGKIGRALLVSLKAGGCGLNLVAANRLYLLDLWWNPAVEEQAIQRVHRIGQKNEVHIFKFVVQDSIDMDLLGLQKAKSRLLEDALEGGGKGQAGAKLTLDDLKRLFSPCKRSLKKFHGDNEPDEAEVSVEQPAWEDVVQGFVPEPAPAVQPPARASAAVPNWDLYANAPARAMPAPVVPSMFSSKATRSSANHGSPCAAAPVSASPSPLVEANLSNLCSQLPFGDSDDELSDSDLFAACQVGEQMAAHSLASLASTATTGSTSMERQLPPGFASLASVQPSKAAANAPRRSSGGCGSRSAAPGGPVSAGPDANGAEAPPPMCKCSVPQPAQMLTVRKDGPNTGRQFYKCGDCNFFQWASAVGAAGTSASSGGGRDAKPADSFAGGAGPPGGVSDANGAEAPPPMCKCSVPQPAQMITVRKEGPNTGRQFYKCGDCNFFEWASAAGASGNSASSGTQPAESSAGGAGPSGGGDCYKCGQSGHWARDCPASAGAAQGAATPSFGGAGDASGSGGGCFKCGQSGHWARDCPTGGGNMPRPRGMRGGTHGGASCYKCGQSGHYASSCPA